MLGVPNAPCGVESKGFFDLKGQFIGSVPNAPCGVERNLNSLVVFY